MEKHAIAKLRYARIAPRKMRLVADTIRGLSLREAEAELLLSARKPSNSLLKLLRSAAANAKNQKLDLEKLYIQEIRVDKGPMYKRWTPRARGAVSSIEKKTSHVSVTLGTLENAKQLSFVIKEPEKKKKKTDKKKKKAEDKEQAEEPKEKKHEPKKNELKKAISGSGKLRRMFRRKSI